MSCENRTRGLSCRFHNNHESSACVCVQAQDRRRSEADNRQMRPVHQISPRIQLLGAASTSRRGWRIPATNSENILAGTSIFCGRPYRIRLRYVNL